MSKSQTSPSLPMILLQCLLVAVTGGFWLLPLGLYFIAKYVYGHKPNLLSVAANTFLMLITGFLWSIPLGIRYYFVMKNR